MKTREFIGIESYTKSEYVGRQFLLPKDAELFNFDIQHTIIVAGSTSYGKMYVKILGAGDWSHYSCCEFKVWGPSDELSPGKYDVEKISFETLYYYSIHYTYIERARECFFNTYVEDNPIPRLKRVIA